MRDILYVFQGIDGKFIKMSAQDNCYKIDSKVPEPASRLVKLLIDRSAQQVALTQSDLTVQVSDRPHPKTTATIISLQPKF